MKAWFARQWPLLSILVLIALAYGPVWEWDYFQYDDQDFVQSNTVLAQGLTWPGVRWAFTYDQPFIMPVVWLSFMADVSLFGTMDAGMFHVSNLIYHLINTILLYILVRMLVRQNGTALFTAALFGLHPQHVEAVVWIFERKELLAFLAGILAVMAYVQGVRRQEAGSPTFWPMAAAGLYLLSLLAKPQWITLPFLLLLLDYWPLGRQKQGWYPLVREKWPFFLLTVLFSWLTTWLYQAHGLLLGGNELPWEHRCLNGIAATASQVIKTFWPTDLAVMYPPMGGLLTSDDLWWPALALLAITLGVWVKVGQQPHWAMGWLWFLGALFPTLGFINGGTVVGMADRWTYLPHVGLFLALAYECERLLIKYPHWRQWVTGGAVVVLLVLAGVTHRQSATWRTSDIQWLHTLESTRPWPNPYVHWLLGMYYQDRHRTDEALVHLTIAYQQGPTVPMFIESLARWHLQHGETALGKALVAQLQTNERTTPAMLQGIGEDLYRLGDFSLAVAVLTQGVAQPPTVYDPQFAQAMWTLTLALAANRQEDVATMSLNYYLNGMNHRLQHCQQATRVLAGQESTLWPRITQWCGQPAAMP